MQDQSQNKATNNTHTSDTLTGASDIMIVSENGDDNQGGIRKCYVFFNVLTVSLGFMQFGFGMNSWSNTQDAWQNHFDWDDDRTTIMGDVLQSITIAGAAVGSLSCSKLLFLPKLRLMLLLNLIIVVGVALSIIGTGILALCIGRFIWGLAFGAFSVTCAKMVNEITPAELSGPFGALNQLSLTFGAALPGTFALAYPTNIKTTTDRADDFYVNSYFRIIWSVPLLIALIQVVLLLTVFSNESPVYLKEHGQEQELLRVMKKFYTSDEAIRRYDDLNHEAQKKEGRDKQITMK